MTTYFHTLKVKISSYREIKKLELKDNGSFYIIYSPEKFKLRLRDSIYLDLKFKLNVPEKLEVCINLLPYLRERCLAIENHAWESNKLKDETIQLDI